MYGKTIDGVLYVVTEPTEGYKPFVYTDAPEAPSGYHAAYYWRETADSFVQTWEIVEDYEDITDGDKAEAYDILMGVSE